MASRRVWAAALQLRATLPQPSTVEPHTAHHTALRTVVVEVVVVVAHIAGHIVVAAVAGAAHVVVVVAAEGVAVWLRAAGKMPGRGRRH